MNRCEAFLRREVLPYAPDAWYQPDSVKVGYQISFTRYFYKPQPLRTLVEIRADILSLEKETGGLLNEIIGAHSVSREAGDTPFCSRHAGLDPASKGREPV